MKLIIAGSRTLELPPSFIYWSGCQFSFGAIDEVVCGMANGVDNSGLLMAKEQKIPVKKFPADWDKYGKAAGHLRNGEMAKYADALLLIWDGESKGSANMKKQMVELGKPVCEVILKTDMTNVKVY